ncbi:hypothetical protein HaLaN_29793 [Haematococcus lacustris]|uniref:Uncharacterized protein n=1 Tax=Haematococcus lacustris TaxID=44745 RepID=A0A6A0AFN1_HAELA|nr:hypothetical protein HaLaN_29793 [Haematococcus lacustris]
MGVSGVMRGVLPARSAASQDVPTWAANYCASPGKRRVTSCDPPGLLHEPFIGAGGVGRPSWGKLLSDIAIYAENVRFSLASHAEKGTPFHKLACCELTTLII